MAAENVCDHLYALRSDLAEAQWMNRVDPALIEIFNRLLPLAQRLVPDNEVARGIKRQEEPLKPRPPAVGHCRWY